MFISKTKLLMAVLVMALVVPAAAYATDAWSDVENGKFYHDAVTWAQGNGMTTGCNGGTGFCPDRVVTRGENITFAKRYDDLNQVWLADIQADADAAQADADTNATNIGTNTAAAATAQADADDNASDINAIQNNIIDYPNPAIARNDTGGFPVTTFDINETSVQASGDGQIIFPIDRPYSVNGVNWELFTVSVCYNLTGGAIVDRVSLVTQLGAGPQEFFNDQTDSTGGCSPLFPAAGFVQGPVSYEMTLKDGGEAEIYSIIVWWVHPDNMP